MNRTQSCHKPLFRDGFCRAYASPFSFLLVVTVLAVGCSPPSSGENTKELHSDIDLMIASLQERRYGEFVDLHEGVMAARDIRTREAAIAQSRQSLIDGLEKGGSAWLISELKKAKVADFEVKIHKDRIAAKSDATPIVFKKLNNDKRWHVIYFGP